MDSRRRALMDQEHRRRPYAPARRWASARPAPPPRIFSTLYG